ncbi:MAG: glycine zipper domain-containing protein [Planctomycetota bacterium]
MIPIRRDLVLGAFCLVLPACATHTGTGMAAGGLLGAGTGAAIGSMTGNAGVGALVGSGLGAMTGGLVGAGLDENDRRNEERIAAATAPVEVVTQNPLTSADIIHMSRSGVSEDVILSSVASSSTIFELSASQIVDLHNQGVSNRVIQAMIDTVNRPRPTVAPAAVVYERTPVYVVEPPPPRVTFGIGYGFGPGCRRRCW